MVSREWNRLILLVLFAGLFYTVQAEPFAVQATQPQPAVGGKVKANGSLSWTPGKDALRSEIYLSTDPNAVTNAQRLPDDIHDKGRTDRTDLEAPAGSVYIGSTTDSTFRPKTMKPGTTYYWRVDSVRGDGIKRGTVWNFRTQNPAFPQAEGFGRLATGGRGGSVYHVTHLNDSGAGSFRDAVSQKNRTVVFDVGGIIHIMSRIVVSANVTIAGQTAPGGGIVIYGNGVSYTDANDSITRYIRYRMGIHGDSGKDAITIADGTDMIFDHVSASWGRDETFSISGSTGKNPGFFTIQNCIIAQGLEKHSCGGLIQNWNGISIFRSLYIDNNTRNPKVKGVNDFTNNVVYNWGVAAYILGGSETNSHANIRNNYFIDGPDVGDSAFTRGNLNFHIYAANNWRDSNRDGILNGQVIPQSAYGTVDWQTVPYDYPSVGTMMNPATAYKVVVSQAGASFPVRDHTDLRLIEELKSLGTMGQIISDETSAPMNGVGTVSGGMASTDTDQDGMPDFWEIAVGLKPSVADNNGDSDGDGYTNLEEYLNWLAAPHTIAAKNASVDIDLSRYAGGFNASAIYSVSNPGNGTVSLLADGHTARFVPNSDYVGPAEFQFTANDGCVMTDTMYVLVTHTLSK